MVSFDPNVLIGNVMEIDAAVDQSNPILGGRVNKVSETRLGCMLVRLGTIGLLMFIKRCTECRLLDPVMP